MAAAVVFHLVVPVLLVVLVVGSMQAWIVLRLSAETTNAHGRDDLDFVKPISFVGQDDVSSRTRLRLEFATFVIRGDGSERFWCNSNKDRNKLWIGCHLQNHRNSSQWPGLLCLRPIVVVLIDHDIHRYHCWRHSEGH